MKNQSLSKSHQSVAALTLLLCAASLAFAQLSSPSESELPAGAQLLQGSEISDSHALYALFQQAVQSGARPDAASKAEYFREVFDLEQSTADHLVAFATQSIEYLNDYSYETEAEFCSKRNQYQSATKTEVGEDYNERERIQDIEIERVLNSISDELDEQSLAKVMSVASDARETMTEIKLDGIEYFNSLPDSAFLTLRAGICR